jgi:hypothetical protein
MGSVIVLGQKACSGWGAPFLLALIVGAICVTPASADVTSLELEEYTKDFGVSAEKAGDALQTQSAGAEADIVGGLEASLGSRYAGAWFDNRAGEFVVPVLGAKAAEAASVELAGAGIARSDYRTVSVKTSWEDLEAAQEQLDQELAQPMSEGLVQTSIDPRTNSVVIRQAAGMGEVAAQAVEEEALSAGVGVEVRDREVDRFHPVPAACGLGGGLYFNCDAPLRGGVGIGKHGMASSCTAGFKATGLSTGNRYVLTAGHCAINPTISEWDAYDHNGTGQYLGVTESAYWGTNGHDIAKIRANGSSYWDVPSWPTQIIEWNPETFTMTNSEHAISSESSSYVGQYACLTGTATGTDCATVKAMDITVSGVFSGLSVIVRHLSELAPVCNIPGNSGGPVFAGSAALGTTSFADAELSECNNYDLYTEITENTSYLGVTVAPRPTQTTIESATALNGNPGWVTVKGRVNAAGVSALNGATVKIKLFKWENNNWVVKAEPSTTLTNGSFELQNWNGVGYGSWIAQAVFPGQSPFVASSSNTAKEGSFTVKDGYQLVNPYSNRCLDVDGGGTANGANLQQWSCKNPLASDGNNQVFTLEPLGGANNFQLVARNSDRCADLINKGTVNGTWAQQWDCSGQTHQRWETGQIVAANGLQYTQFKTKHTSPGKCLEISGPNPNDGAKAQIWDCLGASQYNQMWTMKSVDAAPIVTQTTAVITSALNGEPGWATVEGEVKAGAHPINGQYVNVNFYKKVGGSWNYIATAQPTLSNNHFSVPNYVVGVGEWKAQAVFNQQGTLGASSSGEPQFTINKGYRLVNQYTGKCLDVENWGMNNGVNVDQWDCLNPVSGHLNQVFTLVPRGNGYYQFVAKHSGRCLDVISSSTNNGAWTEQWDCLGDGQFNQIWKVVPMPGGWAEFVSKHANKCLEIGNGSLNNGAKAQQWDCYGYGHQQWGFQSVTW